LFGVFTLSFAIAGYASIFDFGLSRALIREVAINKDKPSVVNIFINTATVLIFMLSTVASLTVFFSSHWIVDFINVSSVYRED
ncbi:oligosaccharide flippase family protein, partial [Psychrobacter sp. SIMBA_152]